MSIDDIEKAFESMPGEEPAKKKTGKPSDQAVQTSAAEPSKEIHLILKGVCQTFEGGEGSVQVLKDISFEARGEQAIAILGPSGCGKSTILRMISGMHHRGVIMPTVGEITLDGGVVDRPHDDVLTVFQSACLAPWQDVLGNVILPFKAGLWGKDVSKEEMKKRALDVIESVGLTEALDKLPSQLSGGMQQRVSLAQTLVVRPRVLCMDEPFSALDPTTRKEMRDLVGELRKKYPCLILFVTHDVAEALEMADRVLVLSTQPATILADIVLPDASGREPDWALSEEYSSFEKHILGLIREASHRSQSRGELTVGV